MFFCLSKNTIILSNKTCSCGLNQLLTDSEGIMVPLK